MDLINIKIDRLYDDKLSGIIDNDMYIRTYERLNSEKEIIKEEINKLSIKKTKDIDIENEFRKFIEKEIFDKRFLSSIISFINYSENKDINIYFNFKNCNY